MIEQLLILVTVITISLNAKAQYAVPQMKQPNNYDYALLATDEIMEEDQEVLPPARRFVMSVSVFPNPVTQYVNIGFSETCFGSYSAQIFDLSGKLLLLQDFQVDQIKKTEKIELTFSAEGVYVLKLIHLHSGITKTYLVVKQ